MQQGQQEGFQAGWDQAYPPAYQFAYTLNLPAGRDDGYVSGVDAGFALGFQWAQSVSVTPSLPIGVGSVQLNTNLTSTGWNGYTGATIHSGITASSLVDPAIHYYNEGLEEGQRRGYAAGDAAGYDATFPAAFVAAYEPAFQSGLQAGAEEGELEGAAAGYDAGWLLGFKVGKPVGFEAGVLYFQAGVVELPPPPDWFGAGANVPEPAAGAPTLIALLSLISIAPRRRKQPPAPRGMVG